MSLTKCRQMFAGALMAALFIGSGAIARAQVDGFVGTDQPPAGKIVPISPGGSSITLDDADSGEQQLDSPPQVELPKYWIGILLAPIPDDVRAQIDISTDEGVLVRQVVPESPAAKAGIEVFDIVVKANNKPVANGSDLMELVKQEGQSGGKILLDVLRRGEQQSIDAHSGSAAGIDRQRSARCSSRSGLQDRWRDAGHARNARLWSWRPAAAVPFVWSRHCLLTARLRLEPDAERRLGEHSKAERSTRPHHGQTRQRYLGNRRRRSDIARSVAGRRASVRRAAAFG